MILNLMQKRRFVFTVLWVGFLLAISFMEAPLKFQAESLTLQVGLEVGYLVFHALNSVEIFLAVVLLAISLRPWRNTAETKLLIAVVVWLMAQTALLYTVLDARTLAIINGEAVPEAPWHLIYIGMEVVKLVMLLGLTHLQINEFERGLG